MRPQFPQVSEALEHVCNDASVGSRRPGGAALNWLNFALRLLAVFPTKLEKQPHAK